MKRLARSVSVVPGECKPPGRTEPSEVDTGGAALPPKSSSSQLPQASGRAGSPAGQVGGHARSPSLTSNGGTPKPKASSGRGRVKPPAGTVKPKKGRKNRRDPNSLDLPTSIVPPSDSGLSHVEISPRSPEGVGPPRPPDSVVMHSTERDGLLSGASCRQVSSYPVGFEALTTEPTHSEVGPSQLGASMPSRPTIIALRDRPRHRTSDALASPCLKRRRVLRLR